MGSQLERLCTVNQPVKENDMDDNQLVKELVANVVKTVNGSCLPLAVKALALENVLLRIQLAELNAKKGDDGDA